MTDLSIEHAAQPCSFLGLRTFILSCINGTEYCVFVLIKPPTTPDPRWFHVDALIGGQAFAYLVPINRLFSRARLIEPVSLPSRQSALPVDRMDKSHIRYVAEWSNIKNKKLFIGAGYF